MDKNNWNEIQHKGYLALVEDRISNINLTWCEQVVGLIEENSNYNFSILDVGCQTFQLYKSIKEKKITCNYTGVDIDKNIVDIGLKYFPELKSKVIVSDYVSPKINSNVKYDYVVVNATLEHIEDYKIALYKILEQTKCFALIGTIFHADKDVETNRTYITNEEFSSKFVIYIFNMKDFINEITSRNFKVEVLIDKHCKENLIEKTFYGGISLKYKKYILKCSRI